MRWDNLFDDLESQLEHELWSEDVDVRAEEERLRLGRMSMRDRLQSLHAAFAGTEYSIRVELGGRILKVTPSSFGKDWMAARLIDDTSRRTTVVIPLASVAGIVLDRSQSLASLDASPDEGTPTLSARLGLAFVLRDLSRRRSELDIVLASSTFHGTIDRVGRDHCELAVHEAGAPRRESSVVHYRMIPLDLMLMVRL